MSSVIGKNIKKYRTQNGLTQKELGQLVGVTTQAVSKWERGGTPDVELLPCIADVLKVSVDLLFGRKEEILEVEVTKCLSALSADERFHRAFSLCWAIEMGLSGEISINEKMSLDLVDGIEDNFGKTYFSKMMLDNGIISSRLSNQFRYFFLMPQPEEGMKKYIGDIDALQKIFRVLSEKNILKIISYLYSRLNTPISTYLISHNTDLTENEVDAYMDMLCDCNLAQKWVVTTEKGEINSYTFRQESSMIPLLCFAGEINMKNMIDYVVLFNRSKPLF